MAALRIELLGGFRVAVEADAVSEQRWARRRSAAVVKLLALAPGHRGDGLVTTVATQAPAA